MNSVNIIGRLTKDPEMKQTQSGKDICSVDIAVNRMGEGSDFFRVTAWGKTAEIIGKHFSKGNLIGITGRLQQNTWEKDGRKYSSVDVVAENITFCEKKSKVDDLADKFPGKVKFTEEPDGGELPF